MSGVGFRSGDLLDPYLLPLYQAVFPEKNVTQATLDAARDEPAAVIFAEIVGPPHPVGFLYYWDVADEFQIIDLGVLEKYRRRGVGKALLEHFVSIARKNGKKIILEVRAGNAPAIALYEAAGFKPIGKRKAYYADGEDAIVYGR